MSRSAGTAALPAAAGRTGPGARRYASSAPRAGVAAAHFPQTPGAPGRPTRRGPTSLPQRRRGPQPSSRRRPVGGAGGGPGLGRRPDAPRPAHPTAGPGRLPPAGLLGDPRDAPTPPTGRTGPSCGGEARGTHPSRPGVRAGRASALRRALRLSLPVPGAPFRRVSTPAFRSRRPPPGEGLGAAVRLGRGRPPVTRCCVLAELRSGAQAASPGNSEVTSGPAAYPRGQGRGPQVCLEAGGRGVRGHLQVPSYRLLRSSVTESWDW